MIKQFILFILGTFFLLKADAIAMIGLEDDHPFSKSYFRTLPNENIIAIGEYLYGDDFNNFALTCLPIRNILMGYKKFFIPEEALLNTIENTPLDKISNLALLWSRTAKKKVRAIPHSIINGMKDYPDTQIEDENKSEKLQYIGKNFKTYVKTLNLLYKIGDESVKEKLQEVYHKIQVAVNNVHVIEGSKEVPYPNLYFFHLKNFCLISPNSKPFLSRRWKEFLLDKYNGEETASIEKDSYEITKVLEDAILPLNSENCW